MTDAHHSLTAKMTMSPSGYEKISRCRKVATLKTEITQMLDGNGEDDSIVQMTSTMWEIEVPHNHVNIRATEWRST